MRDYKRVLDKKGVRELFRELANKHPDRYREVSHKLANIGWRASQETGGFSFGLDDMKKSVAAEKIRQRIVRKVESILSNDKLTDQQREDLIIKHVGGEMEKQQEEVFAEALSNKNPLAMQVMSGSRGSPMNLASLLGSDLLYTDHRDRVIPVPIMHSYNEGLRPEEYWAGTYGARKGVMATKFATQEAGFLAKQLNQVAHRLIVVDEDEDEPPTIRGLPVDTDDPDSEGALLARGIGGYDRNTPLTPKILNNLRRQGFKRILIRSPVVGGSPEGGLYARDVGIRERSGLPGRGENVGLAAAQALSEPLSQAQLSAKHSGGVAGSEKALSGFDYINQLIQVPKRFKGGAAHSQVDGIVTRVEPAPAGGVFVYIGGEKHYVGEGFDVKVKRGQNVEAGDLISEGIPNPSEIVRHKGVGEGRRYFTQSFRQAMTEAGLPVNRRNVELLSRGLIDHVRLTDEHGPHVPDDVIPYSALERSWKPRKGHRTVRPSEGVNRYLERPYLHYTIGTKVRPSMMKDFEEFGIDEIDIHDNPPPFAPEMIRGMYSLQHDPDWLTRMYGSGLKGSILRAAQRGGTSDEMGTSFIPSLAKGVDFGRQGIVQQSEPAIKISEDKEAAFDIPNPLAADIGKPRMPAPQQIAAPQQAPGFRPQGRYAPPTSRQPMATGFQPQSSGLTMGGMMQMFRPFARVGQAITDVQKEYAPQQQQQPGAARSPALGGFDPSQVQIQSQTSGGGQPPRPELSWLHGLGPAIQAGALWKLGPRSLAAAVPIDIAMEMYRSGQGRPGGKGWSLGNIPQGLVRRREQILRRNEQWDSIGGYLATAAENQGHLLQNIAGTLRTAPGAAAHWYRSLAPTAVGGYGMGTKEREQAARTVRQLPGGWQRIYSPNQQRMVFQDAGGKEYGMMEAPTEVRQAWRNHLQSQKAATDKEGYGSTLRGIEGMVPGSPDSETLDDAEGAVPGSPKSPGFPIDPPRVTNNISMMSSLKLGGVDWSLVDSK